MSSWPASKLRWTLSSAILKVPPSSDSSKGKWWWLRAFTPNGILACGARECKPLAFDEAGQLVGLVESPAQLPIFGSLLPGERLTGRTTPTLHA
jgi:hypothetical protein